MNVQKALKIKSFISSGYQYSTLYYYRATPNKWSVVLIDIFVLSDTFAENFFTKLKKRLKQNNKNISDLKYR